jgi:flagellar basal-body rod protein FlgC
MYPAIGIALSGLDAATLRLRASASNIVNMNSRGATPGAAGPAVYTPVEVRQTALASGGVESALTPSARAAILSYDPSAPFPDSSGYVSAPDIDPAAEFINLLTARSSYAAGLAVVRTSDDMMKDAIEIIA